MQTRLILPLAQFPWSFCDPIVMVLPDTWKKRGRLILSLSGLILSVTLFPWGVT